jgi:hypothetical protein
MLHSPFQDLADVEGNRKPREVVYTKTEAASDVFEKVPDKKLVEEFITFLVSENVLTKTERFVKKDYLTEALDKHAKRFQLTYEEVSMFVKF